EAGTETEQARDLAAHDDGTLGRPHDPGQDLEQRALAGPVRPDDAERLAVAELDRDVTQRPEALRRSTQHEVRDGRADRRLPVEPEVVPDPEVDRLDGVLVAGAHSTFANSGSTRLKNVMHSASNTMLARSRPPSATRSGGWVVPTAPPGAP